jgi:F-type H+-transporting ATPase subunit epsilon
MARTPFQVEILTPEGEVFNEEVEMLSTRTAVGSLGVLANHTPLLGMLEPTELRLYRSETDIVRFAQGEGYIQVGDNRALVLVEDAIRPEDLDVAQLRAQLQTATAEVENAAPGTEAQRRALRDQRRWKAFLGVAGDADA